MAVPDEVSLAELLAQAERRVSARIELTLGAADLTTEQWRVLTLLADGTGHPMSEIASYAMVPAPTLTKIIDRLIERTLVYRRVDSEDRRRVLVYLSSRGAELYRLVSIDVREAERKLADALGKEETTALTNLLGQLLEKLD